MSSLIVAGLGLAGIALGGRWAVIAFQRIKSSNISVTIPKLNFKGYYKGGFEEKMSKREASLILGISSTSHKERIREAHRRIMLLNHPDRGGSPYLAAKINEAKDYLEKQKRAN